MTEDMKQQILERISSVSQILDGAESGRKYRNIVGALCLELVRSGDRWFLDESIKIARLVTDDPSKAYLEIAKTMAKVSINKNDFRMLDEALQITEKITDEIELSVALHDIVQAHAVIGIKQNNETFFSRSLDLINKIPRVTYRSSAYRNIARVLLKTNPEKAKQLIETSIEIIEGKKIEPIFLASAFLEISHLTATLNDPRSRDFLRRAIELVEKIDYEPDVSAILLKTIETEVALAKLLNDNTMIKEAARLSERISREYYKTLAIKCISG
jgi:tetratricopeptide (TPR) repeat protein